MVFDIRMTHLRDRLRALVALEARPLHKLGHQARLYELSREIGLELTYDDDVVYAACWLHDLGVFEGNRPARLEELEHWDHVAYAVRRSNQILASLGLGAAMVQHVATVVCEHQPHDRPSSLEAIIVRDADILEQLGSIAILRTAAKLGSDTRFESFSDVTRYLTHQLETLPAKLMLDSSRKLALAKQDTLRIFLRHVTEEAKGRLDG